MPKISLIENTSAVRKIFLRSLAVCPVHACGYEKDCAGKNVRRDNDFTCNLTELIALFKKKKSKK